MPQNWKGVVTPIACLMLLSVPLMACTTISRASKPTPLIAGAAIPCRNLPEITYSAPDRADEPDPKNEIDTLETIREIRRHNAKVRSGCDGTR